jgi:adenylate cyclase
MAEERVQRRLAAILAADVVGYSRLMEQDETGTLARLQSIRAGVIDPKIAENGGRIVKTMGDGVLVEFPSAVAAVENALSIQQAISEHEADQPEGTRLQFRVGVNLGDVIIEGDDIHGDGVNVAARLEGLCQAGEVYVSATVHDHVEGKLAALFEDLGEHAVKNMIRPVRVYRASTGSGAAAALDPELLPTSDKPSIAVLPFTNMSGDPEQEYFADGITEDIITALSRWRTIPVIARNSSFVYKGQPVDIKKIGAELGVRYVLEGSVRKAGNRIRITAQLIEADTNHHIWAERYDRELEDIFALQDEIVQRIAAIIEPTIERTERQRSSIKPTNNLTAWDYCLQGYAQIYLYTKEATAQARVLFNRAIALDPQYARAHTGLSTTYSRDLRFRWCPDPNDWLRRLFESARRAITLDELDSQARTLLVRAYHVERNAPAAITEARRAVELNPNDALVCNIMGACYLCLEGARQQEGIPWFEKALELNPLDPQKHNYLSQLAVAQLCNAQHETAIDNAEEAIRAAPEFFEPRVALASAYGYLGRTEEAQQVVDGFDEAPQIFVEQEPRWSNETKEHVLAGLRKAGLSA